jgi:hypothetical protein
MSWVGNGKARGKPQRRAMYRMVPQKFGRGTMTALRFDTGKQTAPTSRAGPPVLRAAHEYLTGFRPAPE